jgi:hypothetical protein
MVRYGQISTDAERHSRDIDRCGQLWTDMVGQIRIWPDSYGKK